MLISDWRSDVCSSDLAPLPPEKPKRPEAPIPLPPKPDKLTDEEQALWLALEARHAGDLLLYEANRIKFETDEAIYRKAMIAFESAMEQWRIDIEEHRQLAKSFMAAPERSGSAKRARFHHVLTTQERTEARRDGKECGVSCRY